VGSGTSGLKRSRASKTESQGSDEFLTSETLLAATAPTISFCTVSLEGTIACSADVSVNSPHGLATGADANTLKLTWGRSAAVNYAGVQMTNSSPGRPDGCD